MGNKVILCSDVEINNWMCEVGTFIYLKIDGWKRGLPFYTYYNIQFGQEIFCKLTKNTHMKNIRWFGAFDSMKWEIITNIESFSVRVSAYEKWPKMFQQFPENLDWIT